MRGKNFAVNFSFLNLVMTKAYILDLVLDRNPFPIYFAPQTAVRRTRFEGCREGAFIFLDRFLFCGTVCDLVENFCLLNIQTRDFVNNYCVNFIN